MNDSNRPGNTDPTFDPSTDPLPHPKQAEALASGTQGAPELIAKKSTKTDPVSVPGWERATLEKLAFASLNEQKATRRWRTFVRLSWLAFFVALVWLALHRGTPVNAASGPHTAVVEVKGEIAADADASAEFVIAALRAAFEDEGSKAIVLEETCASAAYYIAVAADKIYVDKASVVGSIGVLMDGFGFTGLMEKLGVERRLMTAGENKGFLDPFSPQSDKQRAFAQAMLDQIHQQFIGVVKAGRGKRLKEVPEMFSGLFWSGQQAVELGLADQLGNLDYVAREVIKAEEIIDYTRRENVAERLAKKFGASMGEGAMKAFKAIPSIR